MITTTGKNYSILVFHGDNNLPSIYHNICYLESRGIDLWIESREAQFEGHTKDTLLIVDVKYFSVWRIS